MKKMFLALVVAFIIPLSLSWTPAASAGPTPPDYTPEYYGYQLLAPEELDDLLAPIALYPDPLIAQILPAATFVDQIGEAARFVRRYGTARVDYQPWDLSVRAIAHYPKLLYMLERDYDWTVALGQAFVEQPQDVMESIQRLRDYAWAQGNLYSTPEQEVIYEADVISIVPARPRYVYIPVYDPYLVYAEPYYPYYTFSVGFTIGAWLNRDCDWRDRRVYYHGWRGSRWVNRARPHIRDRRNIYITPRASVIRVNRNVIRRDTSGFRERLRSEGVRRRQDGRLPAGVIRTERPRPGRIERPAGRGAERRRGGEPARPGVQRLEQSAPAHREEPAATGAQPRPARQGQSGERRRELRQINRPSPTGVPPATSQPPARVIQTPPSATQQSQPPAGGTAPTMRTGPARREPATGSPRSPARQGQSGERRRELRQINRPSPTGVPPATSQPPARVIQTPPSPAGSVQTPQTPAPVIETPRTPARAIEPRQRPNRVIQTPTAPTVTPAPPAATPSPAPSSVPQTTRPAATVPRTSEPAQQPGRGRSTGGPVVPRGIPRERR